MFAVAVINDLIFGTKIRSTAQSLGFELRMVKTAAELADCLTQHRAPLVIVDLNSAGAEALPSIQFACGHHTAPKVIGFVSHVDEQLASQAAEYGAEVIPRSRFNVQLPAILRGNMQPENTVGG